MKLMIATVLALGWWSSGPGAEISAAGANPTDPPAWHVSMEQATEQEPININKASAEALQALPRIGKTVAQRIVAFREEHGPFERIEELMNVRGVGEKTFLRLKDRITVGSARKSQSDSPAR